METAEKVGEGVIEAVAAICDMERSQVTLGTTLGELAMDSLRITAFSAHIQAMHDCVVTPDDVVELLEAACVADLVGAVRRILNKPTSN